MGTPSVSATHDHGDCRAGAGAEILTSQRRLDRAIGVNADLAGAIVPAPTPGVHAHSQSALDVASSPVSAWVPALFPISKLGGDGNLFAIDLAATGGEIGVLREDKFQLGPC